MTVFEPRISGVRITISTNCATTATLSLSICYFSPYLVLHVKPFVFESIFFCAKCQKQDFMEGAFVNLISFFICHCSVTRWLGYFFKFFGDLQQ